MYLTNQRKVVYVKDAPRRTVTCARCSNTTEQPLACWEAGAFLRFAGMHLAGKREYGYVCPVCMEVSEILTKDQALSLGG